MQSAVFLAELNPHDLWPERIASERAIAVAQIERVRAKNRLRFGVSLSVHCRLFGVNFVELTALVR